MINLQLTASEAETLKSLVGVSLEHSLSGVYAVLKDALLDPEPDLSRVDYSFSVCYSTETNSWRLDDQFLIGENAIYDCESGEHLAFDGEQVEVYEQLGTILEEALGRLHTHT